MRVNPLGQALKTSTVSWSKAHSCAPSGEAGQANNTRNIVLRFVESAGPGKGDSTPMHAVAELVCQAQ